MDELVFTVMPEDDGGFSASCQLPDGLISTQGDNWADLESMVRDAVLCHLGNNTPVRVRLHLEKDSVLTLAAARSCRAMLMATR
jgi:hypothetical protein